MADVISQKATTTKAETSAPQKKMRTIGRWYIGETLGKGGYSWVKKGFDKKTGKCVALKFMAKADESWAKEQSKQVVAEIESLKHIRHPNVMKLYAYNLNARYPAKNNEKIDTVLLVLEFAPGGEIFDILYYTSALEPILARTYFRQAIFALEACHNAGVAHRDIKPQNLLLDSRFNLKLTDFGLSKVFESDADAIMKTTYVGTRGYQAPELLLDKTYDLECDIFSMAVVLFILITGYPPFEQAHFSDRWFRPLTKGDNAKFWKYHSGCAISNDAKCKDLLEKMFCYDPKQRITIAQIKKHPWFNGKFLEGKELIRALRHRHREMEAKRRKDARKVKDLQHSITKSVKEFEPEKYPLNQPEEVAANTYTTLRPHEFFNLMKVLITEKYHGEAEFDPDKGSMHCIVRQMLTEKKKKSNDDDDDDEDASPITGAKQEDYGFEIKVYGSRQYVHENDQKETNQSGDVDNQAADDDEKAHSGTVRDNVYVVSIRRTEGDELKFQKIKAMLLGVDQLFTGLPVWAQKIQQANDPMEKILNNWENTQEVDDVDYENIDWSEESV